MLDLANIFNRFKPKQSLEYTPTNLYSNLGIANGMFGNPDDPPKKYVPKETNNPNINTDYKNKRFEDFTRNDFVNYSINEKDKTKLNEWVSDYVDDDMVFDSRADYINTNKTLKENISEFKKNRLFSFYTDDEISDIYNKAIKYKNFPKELFNVGKNLDDKVVIGFDFSNPATVENLKNELKSISDKTENISKQSYFDYLDSPQYVEVAKKMWGSDYMKNIDAAKNKVQSVGFSTDDIDLGSDLGINIGGEYNSSRNKVTMGQPTIGGYAMKGMTTIDNFNKDSAIHELSHSSDVKNETSMNDEYLKWESLHGQFLQKAKNKNIDNLEYYSKPTEVRARINVIRKGLIENGVDFQNKSKENIIENIKSNSSINKIYDEIKYLDDDMIINLLQNFASTNGSNKNKNIA